MPDDRKKPPRIMGDDHRAVIGRTHRIEGVPAFIDPTSEVSASVLMAAQLDVFGDRLEQINKSVTTWANETVRHNEQIKALSTSVGAVVTYTESSRLSQLKAETKLERTEELLVDISATLKDLVARIGRLENSVERLTENHESLEERLAANERNVAALDGRVGTIERRLSDAALTTAVAAQTTRRIFSWARAGLVGLGGLVTFVLTKAGDIADWFRT